MVKRVTFGLLVLMTCFTTTVFADSTKVACTVKHVESCAIKQCEPFYGSIAVIGSFDKDTEKDLTTTISHLAVGKSTDQMELYTVYNQKDKTVDIQEALVKFSLFDVNLKFGQMATPFGINYLDRPENSVFISVPRYDTYDLGFMGTLEDSRVKFDAFYGGNNNWSARIAAKLFGESIIPSYSMMTNQVSAIGIQTYYTSLGADISVLGEWLPDNGNTWLRTVVTPGFYNKIGFMASYYNTVKPGSLNEFDFNPDAWTAGFYLVPAEKVTASFEWKKDEGFIPVTFEIATTF